MSAPDLMPLLQHEGGFVDNPADKGGPTNFGITEQRARADGFTGDMRALPIDRAKTIYIKDYWLKPAFDEVDRRMPSLAAELFDTGVNMGPKVAVTFLQRALNVLNRGGSDYPDVAADGDIGDMTLHALDGLAARRPNAEVLLIRAVIALKRARYIAIAEANPSQEAFETGWLERDGATV